MRTIPKGSTSQSVFIRVVDSSTFLPEDGLIYGTAGLVIYYQRLLGSVQNITLSELTDETLDWQSGGFCLVGDGVYRLDVPDAAFVTGSDSVRICGHISGMIIESVEIQLTGAAVLVSQVPVPTSRIYALARSAAGLTAKSKGVQIGEVGLFGVDFAADLGVNGRITSLDAVTIKSGTSGGVTFDSDSYGVDKSVAKFELTAVTAGSYTLNVVATRASADGGGTVEGDIPLVVVT